MTMFMNSYIILRYQQSAWYKWSYQNYIQYHWNLLLSIKDLERRDWIVMESYFGSEEIKTFQLDL